MQAGKPLDFEELISEDCEAARKMEMAAPAVDAEAENREPPTPRYEKYTDSGRERVWVHACINTDLLQERFSPLGQLVPVEQATQMQSLASIRIKIFEIRNAKSEEDLEMAQHFFDEQREKANQLHKAVKTAVRTLGNSHKAAHVAGLADAS
eukprot:4082371-Alexandrium_andersonii.AAC.1